MLFTRVSCLDVRNKTGYLHFLASSIRSKSFIENDAFFLIDLFMMLIMPDITNDGRVIYSYAISTAIFYRF